MESHKQTDMDDNVRQTEAGLRESKIPVYGSGRFRLPEGPKNIIGLEEGDPVSVAIIHDDGTRSYFTREVQQDGRMTIPSRIRNDDEHPIEDGSTFEAVFTIPEVPA